MAEMPKLEVQIELSVGPLLRNLLRRAELLQALSGAVLSACADGVVDREHPMVALARDAAALAESDLLGQRIADLIRRMRSADGDHMFDANPSTFGPTVLTWHPIVTKADLRKMADDILKLALRASGLPESVAAAQICVKLYEAHMWLQTLAESIPDTAAETVSP